MEDAKVKDMTMSQRYKLWGMTRHTASGFVQAVSIKDTVTGAIYRFQEVKEVIQAE